MTVTLECILATVPWLVPHGNVSIGEQLKLEDMWLGMALDISHERSKPSNPVEHTWQE